MNTGKKGLIVYKPERICPCKRGLSGPGPVNSRTEERWLIASPDHDCRIITGNEISDMAGIQTSGGPDYPFDFTPGFSIPYYGASCDWFLRLDVKLLVLKFSSIMQDFNRRV